MLLRLYEDPEVVSAIAEDPENAPIPDLHKLVFRWTQKFVRHPWTLGADNIGELRSVGLADREITQWVARASAQSWFTMCADGAGVELDGGLTAGPAVGRERQQYENDCRPKTAEEVTPGDPDITRRSRFAWVETNESSEVYQQVRQRAVDRWGTSPNILAALSSLPDILDKHLYMIQLLERPQSLELSPRTHALVRAEVARVNQSGWADATISALISQHKQKPAQLDDLALALTNKLVTTPWKVTGKEAAALREAGYSDEVYLDILDTAAIQNALDRLVHALGIPPDEDVHLERS